MSLIIDDIDHESTVEVLLFEILQELKIINTYNELGHDCKLTEEDIKEDA